VRNSFPIFDLCISKLTIAVVMFKDQVLSGNADLISRTSFSRPSIWSTMPLSCRFFVRSGLLKCPWFIAEICLSICADTNASRVEMSFVLSAPITSCHLTRAQHRWVLGVQATADALPNLSFGSPIAAQSFCHSKDRHVGLIERSLSA
jgi:hypothetical protein